MASPDFVDPYLDPHTGVLRNLVAAKDHAARLAAEGALVFSRTVQLLDQPPKPTGDLAELKAIHRYLFQDVFDWAGQIRTVDIQKKGEGAAKDGHPGDPQVVIVTECTPGKPSSRKIAPGTVTSKSSRHDASAPIMVVWTQNEVSMVTSGFTPRAYRGGTR